MVLIRNLHITWINPTELVESYIEDRLILCLFFVDLQQKRRKNPTVTSTSAQEVGGKSTQVFDLRDWPRLYWIQGLSSFRSWFFVGSMLDTLPETNIGQWKSTIVMVSTRKSEGFSRAISVYQRIYTLPPIITSSVENGALEDEFIFHLRAIFHFHDCWKVL